MKFEKNVIEVAESIVTKNSEDLSYQSLRVIIRELLLDELVYVMNELHDLDYSRRFYSMVLYDHINAVISRRELLRENELNRAPELYPINSFSFPTRKQKVTNLTILTIKYFITLTVRRRIGGLLHNEDELHVGFPGVQVINNGELGGKLPQYYPFFWSRGDKKKREKLDKIAELYDDIYMKNVIKEMPKILVEHFSRMIHDIPLVKPEKKVFHIHSIASEYNKLLVAKYVEHGAKLIWYQHGAESGEFKEDAEHLAQHDKSDEFRTWGWKRYEKDRPWKAYRLEEFKNDYDKLENSNKHDLLICFPVINIKREEIESATRSLLSALSHEKYRSIIARPRRSNRLFSHKSEISFIEDPRVVKSTGRPLIYNEITTCRIVLQLNVPSTNFLECIYVDHPVVGLLGANNYSEIIEPYYDFFLEKGVLHKDIESLAQHLNEINIEEWWSGITDMPMYKSFKHTFTRDVNA